MPLGSALRGLTLTGSRVASFGRPQRLAESAGNSAFRIYYPIAEPPASFASIAAGKYSIGPGASRVRAALRVLQQLFSDTLVALGTAGQHRSLPWGYTGPRRSNGPDNAQAEASQLVSTARRIPIRSGSSIMGNDTRCHLFDLIMANPIRDVSPLTLALSPERPKTTLRDVGRHPCAVNGCCQSRLRLAVRLLI
ncbi:hypothetical protein SAMN05216573_1297 [Bradyrhizobium sp. Rc3b]|nr:hypothetical protein SAMN05216573_1297 [Bradyrhizobium sp. Rc3b]